jgi:hypothetical protein
MLNASQLSFLYLVSRGNILMKPIIFITSLLLLNTMMSVVQAAACPTTGQVMAAATTVTTFAVTFKPLTAANQWVRVGGLTLTAPNPGLYNSAKKVADAFANHLNGVNPKNDFGASALSDWNSGVSQGPIVTFISVDNASPSSLVVSASSEDITPTITSSSQLLGDGITLSTLLQNNTVCVGSAGLWQGQEYHKTPSGAMDNLIDYHHGKTSTTDPIAPVGSWSISDDTVNYTYHGGSTPYKETVYNNGDGTYTFCDQNGIATMASSIKPGQVGC